jgi:HK97 family phage prohead protease
MRTETKRVDFREWKLAGDGDKVGTFEGWGAVFGNVDSYGDVIEKGAFKRTLQEWKSKRGKNPPMLLQHGGGFLSGSADDMVPVGQWVHMEERSKGLWAEGKLFGMGTDRGQFLYENLKAGELDGLSIGFSIKSLRYGDTSKDEPHRTLLDVDLWELSIVTFPANDRARIMDAKSAADELKEFGAWLRATHGFSQGDAATAIAGLKKFDAWRQRNVDAKSPRNAVQSPSPDIDGDGELSQLVRGFSATLRGKPASDDGDSLAAIVGRSTAALRG